MLGFEPLAKPIFYQFELSKLDLSTFLWLLCFTTCFREQISIMLTTIDKIKHVTNVILLLWVIHNTAFTFSILSSTHPFTNIWM